MNSSQAPITPLEELVIHEFPGVCPVKDDTREMAHLASSLPVKRALDMGTGTGYIAICLAKKGIKTDAVDNNPRAIANAKLNIELNRADVNLIHSSLYDTVKGPYDLILFNPPRIPNENIFTRLIGGFLRRHDWLLKIFTPLTRIFFGDKRGKFIASFIRQSKAHLSPCGKLLLNLTAEEIPGLQQTVPEISIERLLGLNANQEYISAITWK